MNLYDGAYTYLGHRQRCGRPEYAALQPALSACVSVGTTMAERMHQCSSEGHHPMKHAAGREITGTFSGGCTRLTPEDLIAL